MLGKIDFITEFNNQIDEIRLKAGADGYVSCLESVSLIEVQISLLAEQHKYVMSHNGERSSDFIQSLDNAVVLIDHSIEKEENREYERLYSDIRDLFLIYRKECIRECEKIAKDKENVSCSFSAVIEVCPKCHSSSLLFMGKENKQSVVCNHCGFRYKEFYDSKDDALRAWNLACRLLKSYDISATS